MARKKGWGRGQPRTQRANTYGALAAHDGGIDSGSGDMNSHMTERLGAFRLHDNARPNPEVAPLARPSRMNNDISKYYEDSKKPVVCAGSWIHKPEVPSSAELLGNSQIGFSVGENIIDLNEELRPNKTKGAYDSNEEYLGTQYQLLREDALRPLRQAIHEVRKNPFLDESAYPPSTGIGIYEPVYLKGVQFSFRGLSAKVAFSLNRVKKLIRWRQSKRLITGTLVVLSPADEPFEDPDKILLATVGARPLSALESNNPPEIDLFFVHPELYDFDPSRKWIMVESRNSFFEASRHTLLALQHIMREPFPLSQHIVKVQKNVEPPEYVRIEPHTDLGSLVSLDEAERFQRVDILQEWPQGDRLTLDTSQSRALQRMLTKKLAIVQGPPGTGKTYVSVVALKIRLANMRHGDPPIIVTCQTNHALDQLLLHVAEFESSFVRLGGQTKDQDKIKKRTLFEVRSTFEQSRLSNSRKNRAMASMRQLTAKMQLLLAPFERGKTPLDHRLLTELGLLSDIQAASLSIGAETAMGIPQDNPGVQMEQWLGRCLERCEHPYQPDDFGMPYEEDDFDEAEQLQEIEAEVVGRDDDDDIEALKGPFSPLSDNYRGKRGGQLRTEADIRAKLESVQDLTTLQLHDRGVIYNYLLRKAKQCVMKEFRELAKQYTEQVHQRKIGQWEEDQGILMRQRIIGMTTTGLSKYRALISSLRPQVVLIEEAAETLEAPVTAACFPTLEHLILVGDHKQLRPHCNIHEFEDHPINFNLSLFERMVNNGIELDTLKRQRRMIPEIRRLLQPIYGSKLQDHPSVESGNNRPPVEGMGGTNSFFFTHEWPESRDNNQSIKNEKEADMIVGFFDYLVLNGVDPAKITVMTFYNGQRKLLASKFRRHQNLGGQVTKIVTVDSYQGEENDIVLLSLVRSSKDGNIGFLAVRNRVCVAISRAKRGFYMFGNAEKLVVADDTWESIVKIMWNHGNRNEVLATGPSTRIGYWLPLTCLKHENKSFVQDASDWELTNGGCSMKCRCALPCGHKCMLMCHPFENDRINCMQKCSKTCPTCGRPCNEICSEPCKCMSCDRRSGGIKSLIKPAHTTRYPAEQSRPSTSSHSAHITYYPAEQSRPSTSSHPHPTTLPAFTTSQASSAMFETATVFEHPGSTPGMWHAYANGGVKAEDSQVFEKQRKDAAKLQELISTGSSSSGTLDPDKLIRTSPKKKYSNHISSNTGLLVDLADDSALQPSTPQKAQRMAYKETFSYAGEMVYPSDSKTSTDPAKREGKDEVPAPAFNLLD